MDVNFKVQSFWSSELG